MKISIILILLLLILSSSSIIAQSRQTASAQIRIKIVNKITVEVTSRKTPDLLKSNSQSAALNSQRDILISFENRLRSSINTKESEKNVSNKQFPKIEIVDNNNNLVGLINTEKKFALENLDLSNNIRFLYREPTSEQATNFEPSLTVVY